MSDADETVWVVFNGEIYNFQELRAELEALGHVFRTRSDTEVIVHGYKQWGTERARAAERHVRPGDLGRARAAGSSSRATRWASSSIYYQHRRRHG